MRSLVAAALLVLSAPAPDAGTQSVNAREMAQKAVKEVMGMARAEAAAWAGNTADRLAAAFKAQCAAHPDGAPSWRKDVKVAVESIYIGAEEQPGQSAIVVFNHKGAKQFAVVLLRGEDGKLHAFREVFDLN